MSAEKVKINYKPLWKQLIDKGMKKIRLREKAGISRSTMVKMTNNDYVALDILTKICVTLDCNLDDIVEVER
jgi:DNA-binding Xre family transcriptional regulator